MEPETVVENIQTDAAVTAAHVIASDTVASVSVVASEVAQVGAALDEHVELTDEQHEEILGDTSWLKMQLEQLSMISQTLLSSVTAIQATMTAEFQTLRTVIESTVTPSLLPLTPELVVIEPESVVAPPEVRTETAPEVPRRRRRVI